MYVKELDGAQFRCCLYVDGLNAVLVRLVRLAHNAVSLA
jgi:hypothetical protein